MRDTAIEIIIGIMKAYGITTEDISNADESIARNYYDEMTRENDDEQAWLDANVRGKEEELRGKEKH